MRIHHRYKVRLFFLFTLLIFIYLAKKVFEIEDLRNSKQYKGIGVLPMDSVNKNDLQQVKLPKLISQLDLGGNRKRLKLHINNDNKVDDPPDNAIKAFIRDGDQGDKGDNPEERQKLPQLVNKKPDDDIPRLDTEENYVELHKNDDNKIDKPTHPAIKAFIKDDDQHNKGKNLKERLKLPPFVSESRDDGLGEHGKKATLNLNSEEEAEAKRLFALNDFNQYISDRISVHRRLDDKRKPRCKQLTYPEDLPKVSVIICFHNEAWTTLLRTVHSIIDRSPPALLREIILVDDFSTMEHLKGPLNQYMEDLNKVKIIRASKRQGLIRARLLGYDIAAGPVLVFLDSHIECFPGWLEPLIARISEDSKAVVFPSIPPINSQNFQALNFDTTMVGNFKWDGLTFTWRGVSDEEGRRRKRNTDPMRSPTMPGGLFAIDKQWFTTLGTYDPGLDYWGGENIELSFKAWMCNGSIEEIPCSQVGHIYRKNNPIKWHKPGASTRNSMRVAEVWMDEYKQTFYDYSFPKDDFGDVSDRLRLRDSLHCHDFKWYLDNVLQAEMPPAVVAAGEIRSAFFPYCLDSMGSKAIPQLFSCHGKGNSQRWVITETDNIMQGTRKRLCFENNRLQFDRCKYSATLWDFDYETGTIEHRDTSFCLALRIPHTLTMTECDGSKGQEWILPEKRTE